MCFVIPLSLSLSLSLTLMTNEVSQSGTSRSEVERTSSIRKQNRDIFGIQLCRERGKERMKL